MSFQKIKTIGLAKEVESPENPGSLEKRVALIPQDVEALVKQGCEVFFEEGAGEGIGFEDSEYEAAGAKRELSSEIYKNKDMVVKFKGPPISKVGDMEKGSVLFCMAHFHSFPDRAALLEKQGVNVIAMEEILQTPKHIPDEIILSKKFIGNSLLKQTEELSILNIGFLGFSDSMIGGIRRTGNRGTKTLSVYQADIKLEELEFFGERAVYFYDSDHFKNEDLVKYLSNKSCQVFDLKSLSEEESQKIITDYRASHPPKEFGGRVIQCLRETGMAGARYGFKLLKEVSKKNLKGEHVKVVILGYGNVGMGAIYESYRQGVRKVQILTKRTTAPGIIEEYLKTADLVVNGAEQPTALRGKNFLVKSEHTKEIISDGSVVIDLVGGSSTNRSPVEDVIDCTFLTKPHFEKNGVLVSALWGWPMLGMMKESAVKYSGQIKDVIVGKENLAAGLGELSPGVKKALVCGPHSS